MKKLIILLVTLFIGQQMMAQGTHFTFNGTIEFEKTLNMYALIKKEMTDDNDSFMQSIFDNYKKTNPQFKKLKSTLTFTKDKALFTPIVDEGPQNNSFFWSAAPTGQQTNTTFTDLTTGLSTTQKKVFEEMFLVKDSTRKINWKITTETRDIAGYTCRRANALVMDSIYVVAFYTEEIPVSAGPESFTGLPGMILGVALPHDSMTWFATKVTDMTIPENKVVPPVKGKPVNNKQLRAKLDEAMSNWGGEGRTYLKVLLL
ncbi:MAG: GLPGLI family protein [Bacteroidota bacterium]